MINEMDSKLNKVVKRTEYEYLNGYNKFVKNKEKDLQALVNKFNQKNTVSNEKEKRIMQLEQFVHELKNDLFLMQSEKEELMQNTRRYQQISEDALLAKAFA